MNTSKLKPFSQKARKILMEGVRLRMLFWGFDGKNEKIVAEPEAISGGVIFRNEVYNDPGLLAKWQQMKTRIGSHTYKDAIEEAAYTWFNRLMALKILEKNDYEEKQLGYEGTVPAMLDKARNGIMPFLGENDKQKVREKLLAGDEEGAFGILLVGYFHNHTLLKRVFGGIDDFTELLLPNNLLATGGIIELLNINGFVQEQDYREVELIGWLYQFYISEKKDEVFKGFKENKKARKEDIPAATQIFTPKWIVKYLVENTVGKTWLDRHPDSAIRSQLKYLVENESASSTKGEGIDTTTLLSLLDPACGSGHILVTAFDLYMLMYKEEGLTTRQAVREILQHNLFGLDIDKRAVQLACFAVLMKAASYDRDILKVNMLPHIYAMPEPTYFDHKALEKFLYDGEELNLDKEGILKDLVKGLDLMRQAQNLGSIIQFDLQDDTREQIKRRHKHWKILEEKNPLSFDQLSWWAPLSQYLNPLSVLLGQYSCVAANPPYMGQKGMNGELKNYVGKYYAKTKGDLMTVFMEVIPNLTVDHGRFALINLPSWLFLSSFEEIRNQYLSNYLFESLLHMGRGIFGIDFGSVAFAIKKELAGNRVGNYFRLHERNFQHIYYEDIEKIFLLSKNTHEYKYDFNFYRDEDGVKTIPIQGTSNGKQILYSNIAQIRFFRIPGNPIAYWVSERIFNLFKTNPHLGHRIEIRKGLATSDNDKYLRFWFEISQNKFTSLCASREETKVNDYKWFPINKGGPARKWFGNNEYVVNWENDGEEIRNFKDSSGKLKSRPQNLNYSFKKALTWSKISSGSNFTARISTNSLFDDAGAIGHHQNHQTLLYVLSLLNSRLCSEILRILNPTMNFQTGEVASIPLILDERIESFFPFEIVENLIDIAEKDWNSRENSWDFKKSPLIDESSNLKEGFNKWEQTVSVNFFLLHYHEEELNQIIINIYNLHEELNHYVALKDITVLDEELDRDSLSSIENELREGYLIWRKKNIISNDYGKEITRKTDLINYCQLPIKKTEVFGQFVSYCIGTLFGRYRLDKPGLNIAHPVPTPSELSSYKYNNYEFVINENAIIPLFGEDSPFADNVVKGFKDVIICIWGEKTLTENINFLNTCLGIPFEKFLIEKFWDYHKKVYQKKPIYWLFSSPAGSFKVLVYMHRMDKFTVQKIRLNYLHRYIEYLTNQIQQAEANKAAPRTIDKLNKALQDCREYDKILKPLADQQITFDLDDGVTVNYEKFKPALAALK
ncbi:MAG: BREX-1 system adenine-specific DNA-methyltransferase PglX [Cyclobacteriaceae bacterium]